MDLLPGQSLKSWIEGNGDGHSHLLSPTGSFRLTIQSDGNLIIQALDDTNYPAEKNYIRVIWDWGTGGQFGNSAHCDMQTDGNMVVYNAYNVPLKASATQGHNGAFLRMQDDGNLVVYAPDGHVLWSSNSEARYPNT